MKQVKRKKWPYIAFWLFGLTTLLIYGGTSYLERTAPVDPVTGFHVSPAGAALVFLFPLMSIVQTMLMLGGFVMVLSGLFGKGKVAVLGVQLLLLGLGIAAINYWVSM